MWRENRLQRLTLQLCAIVMGLIFAFPIQLVSCLTTVLPSLAFLLSVPPDVFFIGVEAVVRLAFYYRIRKLKAQLDTDNKSNDDEQDGIEKLIPPQFITYLSRFNNLMVVLGLVGQIINDMCMTLFTFVVARSLSTLTTGRGY